MQRLVLTLAGAGMLAACGAASPAGTAPPTTSGPSSTGSTVNTGTTSLGTVLTDSKGFTLYYFLPEKGSTVGPCTGGCLTVWPPLVVTGAPTEASGATGTLATVSIMLNGAATTEVTYNGWPLHTYASDTAAGQTGGQGIMNMWFAAMPGTSATATGATTGSNSTPTPAATKSPGGYGY